MKPDIAVVDINMPGINGIKLIQLLKERGHCEDRGAFVPPRVREYAVDALNARGVRRLLSAETDQCGECQRQ